ncbi:putative membrane protein [Pseudarthrobacter siccitolerans]|uniref:Putative membrane protein n=1 Tax=Pseudarthrobacter siccitolerans TaxID=861266 RepID=A0A024GZX8_9MICC|nr:O-antigen polymerase [Pseudarthrobacter siccitolerans]CCQ45021.1 putative membrane protein [Pseudarthrobacter siccitolerans]
MDSRARNLGSPTEANSTGRKLSLRTLFIVVSIPLLMFGIFGSLPMAFVTAFGLIWIYFAVLIEPVASKGLSAARLYVPIFIIYNGIALTAPGLRHGTDILLMTLLSAVGFLSGWLIGLPRRSKICPAGIDGTRRNDTVFRRPVVLLATFVTIAVYGVFLVRAGTLPIFTANPNVARVDFLPNGYVSTVVVIGLHIMIACGLVEAFLLRSRRAKLVPLALLVVGSAMAFAMGNRGVAINPIVFATLFVLWQKNFSLRKLIPIGLIAVLALSIAGYFRNLSSWGQTYVSDLEMQGFSGAGVWLAPVMNYVFGTAQTFDTTITFFPATIPFQSGAQFFSPFLLEQSADLYLKQVFGLRFDGGGLALGSVNAFYLDWGFLGTFLGPVIYGFVAACIYRRALLSADMKWSFLYCFILMQLIFSVYGHPFAYLTYFIEPFLFFWLIVPVQASPASALASTKFHPARGMPSMRGGR